MLTTALERESTVKTYFCYKNRKVLVPDWFKREKERGMVVKMTGKSSLPVESTFYVVDVGVRV